MTASAVPPAALWQHGVALALVITDICARAGRMVSLVPVGFVRAMIVNCCGDAIAALTPARLGGEPLRFVGYTRTGLSGPTVLAAFATETVLDTILLGGGALLLLVFFAESAWPAVRGVLLRAGSGPIPLILAAATLVSVATFVVLSRRRRTHTTRATNFLRDTWTQFRGQSPGAVVVAGLCTAASILARMAILPVLLVQIPGISTTALIAGSIAALYVLLLVPTPGGAGVVEAGFFAGFGDTMSISEVAVLIITWRAYAWLCSAGVGAVLLMRERLRPRLTPAPGD